MELTNTQRHDIARETAEYWKYNGNDDEFHDNCKDTITAELEYINEQTPFDDEDEFEKEYQIILNLIIEKYHKNNWEAIDFFKNKKAVCIQYKPIIINNLTINDVWEISLEHNEVILYNSAYEIIGKISYYDIINISIGDKNAI